MPVRAFVDDSGSGGDSSYFVLGGFLADFPTWERFSDDWDAVLSAPPSIEYFKMVEANALNEQFEGWSGRDRDAKVNALIDVINSHHVFQGTCAIDAEDYKDVVIPVLGDVLDGKYNDPYLMLFMGIIGHMAAMEHRWEYAQRNVPIDQIVMFDDSGGGSHTGMPPQKVDFVFDTGKKLTDRAARTIYDESLKKLNVFQDRLGTVDFKDDKVFLPLQAADLAAWQRRRRLCARREGTRPEYERLHRNPGRFKHTSLSRSDMQDMMRDIILGIQRMS